MPSGTDIGAEFEGRVQAALEQLKKDQVLSYSRLYDTRSAGNFLPEQPADFIGCVKPNGRAFLIECKATAVHESLASCFSMVEQHQAASLGLWAAIGAKTFVMFWSAKAGVIEIWDGKLIAKNKAQKKRLARNEKQSTFWDNQIATSITNTLLP